MIRTSILTLLLITFSFVAGAQCMIKQNDSNSGYITYYIDPELVAQTNDMGIAMSVQMVGDKHYLAITYQFAGKAEPVEEKVAITLKSGYTIELDMYTMEVANAAGVELCMAVFHLEETQVKYLKSSPMVSLDFSLQKSQVKKHIEVSENANVLIRQLKCFGK